VSEREGDNIPTNCEGPDRDATHVRSADASYPQPHPAPIKDEESCKKFLIWGIK